MTLDPALCYQAVKSRDSRFDGCFVTAVRSTGIYCRPSCPAITPRRANVEFFRAAAAAQQHGYRACKRCRPDASPGSPEWNARADVVGRAMRLIADGWVDRSGVEGLAERLGYSQRQVGRLLTAELGAGPLALARAQRAQTARVLIETTDLPITEVAFAAGFASVRQFNDTVREVFAATPSQLRAARSPGAPGRGGGELALLLACRQPFDADGAVAFLGRRAVAGVEAWDGRVYARSLRLARGAGVAALSGGPRPGSVSCSLWLDDLADAQSAVQRCRRMLDLDSDPSVVDARLGADPTLAPLVAARPGLRSPGHPDGAELLARAILGQQVSVDRARALAECLVAAAGEKLARPRGGVTMLFPSAVAIAALDPSSLPMPGARARALTSASAELASGRLVLDAGSDRAEARAALLALPGVGPWTADYVALRALGDPDAFLPTDGGVRRAAAALGLVPSPSAIARRAVAWRPWRAYALHHLWASLQGDPR